MYLFTIFSFKLSIVGTFCLDYMNSFSVSFVCFIVKVLVNIGFYQDISVLLRFRSFMAFFCHFCSHLWVILLQVLLCLADCVGVVCSNQISISVITVRLRVEIQTSSHLDNPESDRLSKPRQHVRFLLVTRCFTEGSRTRGTGLKSKYKTFIKTKKQKVLMWNNSRQKPRCTEPSGGRSQSGTCNRKLTGRGRDL